MRRLAILTILALALPASAKPPTPIVELRVRSLDDFLGLADYFAAIAGKPETGQQVVALANAFTKEKTGLEGVDRARPIGAYVITTAANQPALAVMLPVKDQAAFLQLLKGRLSLPVEASEGGAYKLRVPNVPVPIYLAFSADYAYLAPLSADWIDEENRVDPKAFFATKLAPATVAGLVVHLDRVGADAKRATVAQAELKVADDVAKGPKPGEPKGQAAFRLFTQKKLVSAFAAVVNQGKSLRLDLGVDSKSDTIALSGFVVPVPGTPMAGYVQKLSERKGYSVEPKPGDAAVARLNFALPESARKEWAEAVDLTIADSLAVAKEGDKQAAKLMFKALRPTLAAGVFDGAVAIGGPDARRLVAVTELVEGGRVEEVARNLAPLIPASEGKLKVDAAKAENAKLHELTVKGADPLFGSQGTFWLGTSADRLVVTSGQSTDAATLVDRAPATGPVLDARIFPTLLLTLDDTKKEAAAAKVAAQKVFADKPAAGRDAVTLSVTGGESLGVSLKVKGQALAFFAAYGEESGK